MKITKLICDVTGQENALTLLYPTGKTYIDPPSGRTEETFGEIDLSFDGAMRLLEAISARINFKHPVTSADLATTIEKLRKK